MDEDECEQEEECREDPPWAAEAEATGAGDTVSVSSCDGVYANGGCVTSAFASSAASSLVNPTL